MPVKCNTVIASQKPHHVNRHAKTSQCNVWLGSCCQQKHSSMAPHKSSLARSHHASSKAASL